MSFIGYKKQPKISTFQGEQAGIFFALVNSGKEEE